MTDVAIRSMPGSTWTKDSLVDHFVRSINAIPLETHPSEHIYMREFFPEDFYRELLENLPADDRYHQLKHPDAMQAGRSTRMRFYLYPEHLWLLPKKQREFWSRVRRALLSPEIQEAYKRKFWNQLTNRFGDEVKGMTFDAVPTLMRDFCGYRITPHTDTLRKTITTQFYLPKDNAQEHIGTIFHSSKQSGPDDKKMPFLPRSGYAFPVQKDRSWHSANATTESDGVRNSLMVIYYRATFRERTKQLFKDRIRGAIEAFTGKGL